MVLNTDVTAYVGLPDSLVTGKVALFYRHMNFPTAFTKVGVVDPGSATIKGLFIGDKYEIAAALVDESGTVGPEKDWTTTFFTPKGSTDDTLPAVTNFGVTQDGAVCEAKWDDVSAKIPNFFRYQIRVGTSWSDARHVAYASADDATNGKRWRWETDGSTVYRIAAFDKYGKRGTEATLTLTIQPLSNFVDGTEQDEDTGGFTATKANTEVSGGKLQYERWGDPADTATEQADTATWLPWGPKNGSYTTAEKDLGSIRNVRLELEMDVDTDGDVIDRNADEWNIPGRVPIEDTNGAEIDITDADVAMELGQAVAAGDESAPDVRVFIKYDDTTPIAQAYQPFIPGFYSCRYYRIQVVLYAWDRWRRARISKLRILERKKNLKDEGLVAVTSTPGPTQVVFAASFISAPDLVATSDQAGFMVTVASISASWADLRVYDDGGTEVFTGSVFWIAAGT